MKKSGRVLAMILAAAMSAALLSGCGGGKSQTQATAAAGETKGESQAAEAADSKKAAGGRLVIATATVPKTFFMPASTTTGDYFTAQPVLEQLGRVDADGNVYPWLAESFETDEDNLKFTIKLRDGVTFHDGSACDADAVVWNIEQYIENGKASEIGTPKSVTAVDDKTVEIQYESWANNWDKVIGNIFIGSKEAYEKNGKDWCSINAVGTGPFKFESYIADNKVTYVKNEDYRLKGQPYVDSLEIDIITDVNTRVSALMNHEVNVAMKFENVQVIQSIQAAGFENIGRKSANVADIKHIIWNSKSEAHPMGDLKVRQAVMHAIDWENVAKTLSGGLGEATPLFCTKDSWAYNPEASFYEYNVDLAKQMLAEAGYPNGFDTTIYATSVNNDTATAFQACLAQIGINAKVEILDSSALAAMQKEDDIDGFIANRGASQMDFTANYIRLYSSEGIKNHGIMLRPAEFEEPLFAARAAKTLDEKKADLQKAAKALVQDYVMITPLSVVYYQSFAQPEVMDSGIYQSTLEQWQPEAVYLAK